MIKWIGRPILLSLVAVASILTTANVASASTQLPVVTITSNPATPVVGQSVQYTVTVTYDPGFAQSPTGTASFTDLPASSPPCTSATLVPATPTITAGTAIASCTTTYTKAESGNFIATYSGDSNYTATTGTLVQTIGAGATTTSIASSSLTSVTGQSIVFTATVSPTIGSVVPAGAVRFTQTGAGPAVPSACNPAPLVAGKATCTVVQGLSASSSTSQTLSAVYNNTDGNFTTSSDLTDATVAAPTPATTRVLITSSASPAVSGQALTFTAQVAPTSPGSGTPTGTVTFAGATCTNPNGSPTQVQTLSGGLATCSVAAGTFTVMNPVSITATYNGAGAVSPFVAAYQASSPTPYTEAENQNTTSITLIVNPKKAHVNNPLSLTAVIVSPPPGSGQITGLVSFVVVGKHSGPLNCANLPYNYDSIASGNEVECDLPALPASATPMKVSVNYYGDTNYLGSSISKKIRIH
ncbi:MAG TPA: hypothetical protein VNC61_10235 [Acidimicrobiales bacterium]|nr:hypothetical protein [Acidimicrobiales bacterium]